jgi:hypothetical protein
MKTKKSIMKQMLDNNPSLRVHLLATDPLLLEIENKIRKDHENVRLYWARDTRQREIDEICLTTRKKILNIILPTASTIRYLPSAKQTLLFQIYNTKGLIYADHILVRFSSTFWITVTIDAPNTIVDTECPMKWMLQIYPDYDTFVPNLDHEDLRMLSLIYGVDPEHLSSTLRESDGLFD